MAVDSSPSPADHSGPDVGPPPPAPVRRVDDDRWQASWARFQSAHDDADAEAPEGGDAQPGDRSAEPGDGVPTPDGPVVPLDAEHRVVADGRGRRHRQVEPDDADGVRHSFADDLHVVPPSAPVPSSVAGPESALHRPVTSAAELTSQTLLRPRNESSAKGWRRAVQRASGGSLSPGLSKEERFQRDRLQRITTPVRGCHRIAVVSLKGGVGKTTTTACLGLTLAHHRGDRLVALDANPDSGTLAERLVGPGAASVTDLLGAAASIRSFTEMAEYTSLAERLQVLGSDQDPHSSRPFDEQSYRRVDEILSRFFTLVLVDSGSGLQHPAMAGTLALADSLVVVAGPSVDSASQAAKTLDWLVAHDYGHLVARSVAVISAQRRDAGEVDVDLLVNHFSARCRAVVQIPFDPHLATGGRIERSQLRSETVEAYTTAAAAVAEGFALDR